MGKEENPASIRCLILLILSGNKNMHKSMDLFKFPPDYRLLATDVTAFERLKIDFSRLLLIKFFLQLEVS